MPTNTHGQGYTDLNFLMPDLLEKIDYREGLISPRTVIFRPPVRRVSNTLTTSPVASSIREAATTAIDAWFWRARRRRRFLTRLDSLFESSVVWSRVLGGLEIERDHGPWSDARACPEVQRRRAEDRRPA